MPPAVKPRGVILDSRNPQFAAVTDVFLEEDGFYIGEKFRGKIAKQGGTWTLEYLDILVATATSNDENPPIHGWMHQNAPAPFTVTHLPAAIAPPVAAVKSPVSVKAFPDAAKVAPVAKPCAPINFC